jgi:hypothetical protein
MEVEKFRDFTGQPYTDKRERGKGKGVKGPLVQYEPWIFCRCPEQDNAGEGEVRALPGRRQKWVERENNNLVIWVPHAAPVIEETNSVKSPPPHGRERWPARRVWCRVVGGLGSIGIIYGAPYPLLLAERSVE